MPIFTIPNRELDLWESNDCHNPGGSPAGGEFCSDNRSASVQAQLFGRGAKVDLVAAANAGVPGRTYTRRFLFNPKTGEFVMGVASGSEGRDRSHAEAMSSAGEKDPKRYDQFLVHGHIVADAPGTATGSGLDYGKLSLQIDRIVPTEVSDPTEKAIAKYDALYRFLQWAGSHGATRETTLWDASRSGMDTKERVPGGQLGKMFPKLYPKPRAPRKPRALPKAA